jgi:FlaA1/EpsC-like NDP-sugar epimerase
VAQIHGRDDNVSLNWRPFLAFAHDVVACVVAWVAAFLLRFNLELPGFYSFILWSSLAWAVPIHGAIFWMFGLYRGVWRYASMPDLKRILIAIGVAAIVVTALLFMIRAGVPRSVFILSPILLAGLMCGSRLAYRAWKERRLDLLSQREPVVVIGAAASAVNLIKELALSTQWRVVGVFDDDGANIGRRLHGVNVLGRLADLPRWSGRGDVAQAIIAMPEASHAERRRALEICRSADLKVLTVPSFDDLVSGKVTVSQVRHVELDDLLGRDPVTLDASGLRGWLSGQVVMVTGAGGSIGAELCRQIARFEPRLLVMFELNEYALYTIEQEFAERRPGLSTVCAIGDVKDAARVEQVLREHRPSVIFHAAAYKHVPLMENSNAWQAVLNNVLGTEVVGRLAAANGVDKFVFVSTDKAVNPTSVMGASKRLAEMVCQSLQQRSPTRFVMVRFGNVLGSTGSVIPKFRGQIAAGGPVTVTHPDITRYFMSIPEAVQLVLQAGLMGAGGEIFLLDMGEPVRIADLARDLIKLSGFSEDDIRIVYSGLRPGEKLYEEPLADDESALPTRHPKLRIAEARHEGSDWLDRLTARLARSGGLTDDEVRKALAEWVPEYRPGGIATDRAG